MDRVNELNAAHRLRGYYASLDRQPDNEIRSQSVYKIDIDDMRPYMKPALLIETFE